jgi:hypothetical protein
MPSSILDFVVSMSLLSHTPSRVRVLAYSNFHFKHLNNSCISWKLEREVNFFFLFFFLKKKKKKLNMFLSTCL